MNKIISGGQSGVDLAALKAAKRFGVPTGGWMPAGYRTEDGPKPEYSILYGMREHASYSYPPRTEKNVYESDATIWFGAKGTAGYACTRKAAIKFGRGFEKIVRPTSELEEEYSINWLIEHMIKLNVINVAGSRASLLPDRGKWAYDYLCEVFGALGFKDSLK